MAPSMIYYFHRPSSKRLATPSRTPNSEKDKLGQPANEAQARRTRRRIVVSDDDEEDSGERPVPSVPASTRRDSKYTHEDESSSDAESPNWRRQAAPSSSRRVKHVRTAEIQHMSSGGGFQMSTQRQSEEQSVRPSRVIINGGRFNGGLDGSTMDISLPHGSEMRKQRRGAPSSTLSPPSPVLSVAARLQNDIAHDEQHDTEHQSEEASPPSKEASTEALATPNPRNVQVSTQVTEQMSRQLGEANAGGLLRQRGSARRGKAVQLVHPVKKELIVAADVIPDLVVVHERKSRKRKSVIKPEAQIVSQDKINRIVRANGNPMQVQHVVDSGDTQISQPDASNRKDYVGDDNEVVLGESDGGGEDLLFVALRQEYDRLTKYQQERVLQMIEPYFDSVVSDVVQASHSEIGQLSDEQIDGVTARVLQNILPLGAGTANMNMF